MGGIPVSVSGLASISLTYSDSTSAVAKVVSQALSVSEDTELTGGTVAVVSGTIGGSAVLIGFDPTTYRNAAGNLVSFTDSNPPTRIVLKSSGPNQVRLMDTDLSGVISLYSKNDIVAMTTWGGGATVDNGITLEATGGTASYVVLIVREE